jgi:hypothetical protein
MAIAAAIAIGIALRVNVFNGIVIERVDLIYSFSLLVDLKIMGSLKVEKPS